MYQSDRTRPFSLLDAAIAWGLVLLWMAAIFYASSQNTWTVISGPPWVQALRKSAHIIEYGVLALLIGRALAITWERRGHPMTQRLMARIWQLGVVIAVLYGFSDEIHQAFVPRREFHLTDVLIDALSATAALGIWYIMRTREALTRTSWLEHP